MSCGDCPVLETGNNRNRSVGRAVRRPCSDSEESDNDLWYAEEHDTTVQQVSRRKDWLTQTANNSCGERCAQLDDFKWFLPAEERAGDIAAPESEIEMSDSESEVEYIEPDSTPVQMETTAQQLRCPPVVAQTRPMEGCHTAVPRQLCRGRDVLMEDGAMAVDTRQVSAASDPVVEYIEPDSTPVQTETTAQQLRCPPVVAQTRPMEGCHTALPRQLCRGRDVLMEDGAVAVDIRQVVSREIHRKSECGPTIVPTLAAVLQTASEVVKPKPRDYCYTDSLPPVGGCLDSPSFDTQAAG